jgi:hypothetical protein
MDDLISTYGLKNNELVIAIYDDEVTNNKIFIKNK